MLNTCLRFGFVVHDFVADILMRFNRPIKWLLLFLAYLSLLGFFVPELHRTLGSWSRDVLLVIVFVSPLSRIFQMKVLFLLMGFRRQLGILMGYLAIAHGLGYLSDLAWPIDWARFFSPLYWWQEPVLVFGFVSLLLVLPPLLTSNAFMQGLLGANWKRVQRLVYPLLLFVLLHSFVRPGDLGHNSLGVMEAVLVFSLYGLTQYLARNNFILPLQKSIDFVAERYREYHGAIVPEPEKE